MLKAAAANGRADERACVLESLLAFKRAGADAILSYFAPHRLPVCSPRRSARRSAPERRAAPSARRRRAGRQRPARAVALVVGRERPPAGRRTPAVADQQPGRRPAALPPSTDRRPRGRRAGSRRPWRRRGGARSHVAVGICRPAAIGADQQRRRRGEARHPGERALPLRPQALPLRVAAEQRLVLDQRCLDLLVRRMSGAIGQQQLPRGLALGQRPVVDAVLDDEARCRLRDPRAVVASGVLARKGDAARGCRRVPRGGRSRSRIRSLRPGALACARRVEKSCSRMSRAGCPGSPGRRGLRPGCAEGNSGKKYSPLTVPASSRSPVPG